MAYFFKILFFFFVLLPASAFVSCQAGLYIAGNDAIFGSFLSIIIWAALSLALALFFDKKEKRNFIKVSRNLGVNPDYVSHFEDGGIIIDIKNRRVFAGRVSQKIILEFSEISSIQQDENETEGCFIRINTTNFDNPTIVARLGHAVRSNEAFQKLRAALGIC